MLKRGTNGITLIALVVTIVVLLILAGVTISLVFGQNGVINKAQEANENTKIEQVREQLELAKGPEYIEGNGKYNPDSYFERIEEEGIIGNKDTDVAKQEDGTYEVTTEEGYIFKITLVPSEDNAENIEIEYIGKADGPRIREVTVTNKTTNSISIEVETVNAEGGTYRYYYKKEGEADWIKADEVEENTYTFSGLEANIIYNIKVEVEKDGKVAERETSTITGELPEGAVQFSPIEWNNGEASTTITTSEEGYTLQYQKGGIAEGSWINTTSGTTISGLKHGERVYGRLYDGTNGSKTANIDVQDLEKPTVVVSTGTITTNSIGVNVQVADNESGMKEEVTYTYYIKKSGEEDSSYILPEGATGIKESTYTFTGLSQKTSYDIKVEVDGDKAGNVGEGGIQNQETGEIGGATGGLVEGNIIASSPTWSNGQASITLSKGTNVSSSLTIQYQVNGITEGSWITGTNVTGLNHNDTIYARLTDGINYGSYGSVEIKDNIAPVINNFSVTTFDTSSITTKVDAIDNQTGIVKYQFEYKLTTETNYTIMETIETMSTSYTYKYNGLADGTAYNLRVISYDEVGNQTTSAIITQNTEKANVVPTNPTIAFSSKTTNSITVNAKSTDDDGDKLTYNLYISTSQNSGFTVKATSSATASGTQVALQATGLGQYTTYYYYVTATDGKETATSVTNSVRTYCPGTGLTCSGPFTTTTTCSRCSGTGNISGGYHVAKFRQNPTASYTTNRRCDACGITGKGRTNAITCSKCNSKFGIHLCTSCEARLIAGSYLTLYYDSASCGSGTCGNCNGTGKVTTNTSCSHGKTSTHSYCSHGYTSQHD